MTDNNSSGGSEGGNTNTNVINLNSLDHTVFQVPASDTKGHNTKLWFRLQPGHAQMIDRVVSSRKFPYRSQGDLLRHAILRHMHFLDALAPVPSVLAQVDAIIEVSSLRRSSVHYLSALAPAYLLICRMAALGKHVGCCWWYRSIWMPCRTATGRTHIKRSWPAATATY